MNKDELIKELQEKCDDLENKVNVSDCVINNLKEANIRLRARIELLESMIKGVID
jgi:hypothetical protein